MFKPIIGITMGDPAGIGPEIAVKALSNKYIYECCKPIVIGDSKIMNKATELVGMRDIVINPVKTVSEAKYEFGCIDVYDMELMNIDDLEYGKASAIVGNAAFQCIKMVIDLANKGEIYATVTNPLNKEAINMAGHHYSGHTEIYAKYIGTKKYSMMLVHDSLRVVHVSTHVSLREACDLVKKERILDVIRIAHKACKDIGIHDPKIGVAGLNPHSGEGGLFGREEIDEIIPAIESAQQEGLNVDGPIPPDSIFSKALGGWYDIVIAMYHDQGHIPLKVLGFVYNQKEGRWESVEGVNITLGLPIIRTSVDHGTAYDQAGKGIANELSLLNAIDYSIKLTQSKKS